MNTENIYIGQIKRTHGVRGEVQLILRSGIELRTKKIKFLLVSEKNSEPVPWFPESISVHTAGFLIKFEGINSEKDARRFSGARVFCSADAVKETKDFSIEGFAVEDKNLGVIGHVAALIEYPGQLILSVVNAGAQEILLPMNKEFVREIDEKKKIVFYDAPEGLVDVYLTTGLEDKDDGENDEEDSKEELN